MVAVQGRVCNKEQKTTSAYLREGWMMKGR